MLVEVLATFGIGAMSIVLFLIRYLPISPKLRDYIVSSAFFAILVWFLLYVFIKTGQAVFILGLAISTFISAILGALAGREISKIARVPKFMLGGPEKTLIKKYVILLATYAELTNRLLSRMVLICDIKAGKKVFNKSVKDHPVLKGCWSAENTIKADAVLKNLRGISEKESELKLLRAFSSLNSGLIDLFGTVASPESAGKIVREVINEMKLGRGYEPRDEHEILLGLPESVSGKDKPRTFAYILFKRVLGPLLRECKRATIQKLQRELEGLAKKEPVVARVKISGDGMLDLSGLYEHLSGMEMGDGMQETTLTFSTTLNACYPAIRRDVGAERTCMIISDAFSDLCRKYCDFLLRYGIMDAIPEDVELPKDVLDTILKNLKLPEEYRLKSGLIYFIRGKDAEKGYKFFTGLAKHVRALCLTNTNPREVRETYGLNGVLMVWLTFTRYAKEKTIPPNELDQLTLTISKFAGKWKGVVFVDCIDSMVMANGFKRVMSWLNGVKKIMTKSKSNLLVTIDPSSFSNRQLASIERGMKKIKI